MPVELLQPFAGNPEFRRQRPLSDATKEKVFQLITGNATENPPRKVAARYGISIERVEAIVRMKQLERKMADEVGAGAPPRPAPPRPAPF